MVLGHLKAYSENTTVTLSHLKSNDVLAIDLTDVVIGEQAIAGSRTILH